MRTIRVIKASERIHTQPKPVQTQRMLPARLRPLTPEQARDALKRLFKEPTKPRFCL